MSKQYIDWFIKKSQIGADLMLLDLFPNSKEVTEQYGILHCCLNKLKINSTNKKVLFISIGDGVKPRGSCTVAFNTQWSTISLDPKLDIEKYTELFKQRKVQRVELIKGYLDHKNNDGIGDLNINKTEFEVIVLAFIHSHANLQLALKFIKLNTNQKCWLISMPCCKKDNLELPKISYNDKGIFTIKNEINIYAIQNCKLNQVNI